MLYARSSASTCPKHSRLDRELRLQLEISARAEDSIQERQTSTRENHACVISSANLDRVSLLNGLRGIDPSLRQTRFFFNQDSAKKASKA